MDSVMSAAETAAAEHHSSHCCFCSMQCGMELKQSDKSPGWVVKPSPDFPVASGKLCQKGFNSIHHPFHEGRLMVPLKREGKLKGTPGKFAVLDWETALDRIASHIQSIQAEHGRHATAVFGGGSLTNELCYLLGKFARIALGTPYIDYNGRYCMSSAAAAGNRAFGIDRGLTFPLSDIPHSKYIILAGTNIAECQPTMMTYLLQAKKNGAVIVTIDPRDTKTSEIADIHVRLQPGFDSVFVNGLLHVILEERLHDPSFISERTVGIEQLADSVKPYTPERIQELTRILPEVTRTIARGFARAESGIVLTARGVEQQVNGVEHTLNYINLTLVTGKIGRVGCGFGAITGQANGQGGREHGQKADQLPGYRSIEDQEAREHIANIWGIESHELPGKGVSAYELFDKILEGEIKAMIVLGSNPVVSSPNNSRVREALSRLDLLVVIDMFHTETAEYADWVLPGSSFLEVEGTLTNLEGRVFYRSQVMQTPGGNPNDSEILIALAKRLGKGTYFPFRSAEDVFAELTRASAGGKADYSGLTYDRLRAHKGLFWPCPAPDHPGTPRMFEESFGHADGRARIIPITPGMPDEPADSRYPYILTTGRLTNHYLSGAQTRRTPALNSKAAAPVAEIHTAVASRIGLRVNDQLRITSRRGSIELSVRVTDNIHPTTVFVPFHWGGEQSINQLTNDALHPISRMPEFKLCAVRLEAVRNLE